MHLKRGLVLLVFLLAVPIVNSGFDFQCEDNTLFGECNLDGEICAGSENLIYDGNKTTLKANNEYIFFGEDGEGEVLDKDRSYYLGIVSIDYDREILSPLEQTEKRLVSQFVPAVNIAGELRVGWSSKTSFEGGDLYLDKKYVGIVPNDLEGKTDLFEDCEFCGKCSAPTPSINHCVEFEEYQNVRLRCPGSVISKIIRSDYINADSDISCPNGGESNTCYSYCDAADRCIGLEQCDFIADNVDCGEDPCKYVEKKLIVIYECEQEIAEMKCEDYENVNLCEKGQVCGGEFLETTTGEVCCSVPCSILGECSEDITSKEIREKDTSIANSVNTFVVRGPSMLTLNLRDNKYKDKIKTSLTNQLGINVAEGDKDILIVQINQKENEESILTFSEKGLISFDTYIIDQYIFEFEKEPLVRYESRIKEEMERNEQKGDAEKTALGIINTVLPKSSEFTFESNIEEQISEYKEGLKDDQNAFKRQVSSVLNKPVNEISGAITLSNRVAATAEVNVLEKYSKVFNGMALGVDENEVEKIKKRVGGIKKVHRNKKAKVVLDDTIHSLNVDEVWRLDARGNNCIESGEECLTGKDVTIAVIDTGVDYAHPDLGSCSHSEFLYYDCGKVVDGYDFINYDDDPMDDHGHGTHVAATAAGNGVLKGVAPDAKIYAYKVLDADGSGGYDGIIAAIERSIDPNEDGDSSDHVDIISMSLGGEGNPDDPLSQAVDNAIDTGVIAVIAAGNDGEFGYSTIGSPGVSRKAITVGAISKDDTIAEFSSRGPVRFGGEIIIKPDVLAPGVDICAAQWDNAFSGDGDTNCNNDDLHVAISGTSMATPHISGVAALLKQMHPNWRPSEIKSALVNNARDLGYDRNTQGGGKVDVRKSMNPSLLINPSILNFGINNNEAVLTIKNIKLEPILVRLRADDIRGSNSNLCGGIVFTNNELFLRPTEERSVKVLLNLADSLWGEYYGNIYLDIDDETYIIPFSYGKFLKLKLNVDVGIEELGAVVYLSNKDFSFGRGETLEDTNSHEFWVIPGDYTAYSIGPFSDDVANFYYVLAEDISLLDRDVEVTLSLSDARPFTMRGTSLRDEILQPYSFELGFIAYNNVEDIGNEERTFGSSISLSGLGLVEKGDKVIFLSNKPENVANLDIIIDYSALPIKENA